MEEEKRPMFDIEITHQRYGEFETRTFDDLKEGVKWLSDELEYWITDEIESIKITKKNKPLKSLNYETV